jgi:hypothetical protein
MTKIGRSLETIGHCSYLGFCKRRLLASKYDFGFWKSQLVNFEEPNAVELRSTLGREIVSNLPRSFKKENNGRFVAVTYTSKVLAVCDSLDALHTKLAKINPNENYYIARLGYSTVAQI